MRRPPIHRLVLPLLALLSGACAGSSTGSGEQADAATPGAPDVSDDPEGLGKNPLVAHLETMLAASPNDGALLYVLARFESSQGEAGREQALAYLERLAALPAWDYPLEVSDFGDLGEDPRLLAVAETLAARAPKLAHGGVAMELDRVDLLPEGLAWDPRRGELLVGSMYQRQILAAGVDGHTRELVPSQHEGLLGVLGMSVDSERDRLWVAAVAAPFIRDYEAASAGQAGVWCFALADGSLIAKVMTSPASQLNDLVALGDGRVLVTDSQTGAVLELDADAADPALRELVPADSFIGANGIVAAADGEAVYVADLFGLHRVEADGSHSLLEPPPGVVTLGGIDGLDRQGSLLVGVQNLFSPGRVWALTLAADGRSLTDARILDDGHPRLQGPTTGVFIGPGRFWYLGNASMQFGPEGMTEAGPEDRHVILELLTE